MFAPPPTATLSRAEIQARRAQLQAKRASGTGGASISSASELEPKDASSPKADKKRPSRFSGNKKEVEEINEADKEAWKIKRPVTGKAKSAREGGSGVSLPATLLPPPPAPPGPPSLNTGSDAESFVDSLKGDGAAHSPGAERKGRAPPKRPARPSGEMFLSPPLSSTSDSFPRALTPESLAASSFRSASPATPSGINTPPPVPGAFPMQPSPLVTPYASSPKLPSLPSPPMLPDFSSPPPSTPPPPIPAKSPLRRSRPNSNPVRSTAPKAAMPKKQHTLSADTGLNAAMAGLRMQDPIAIGQARGEQPCPPRPSRAATAPAEMSVLTGIKPLQIRKAAPKTEASLSRNGTGSSRVASPKAISPHMYPQRVGKQAGIRRQFVAHHRRGSSGASARFDAQKKAKSPSSLASPKQRKIKGETMAMLQTTGFFSGIKTMQIVSATSFLDKELPETPNSIVPTPTELYQPSRNSLFAARNRSLSGGSVSRSPLSVVGETDVKANGSLDTSLYFPTEDLSPHRLTTIMENRPLSEKSPPASGTTTPTATQIHLRGGSVVTVTPPELTAWQRSIYIQGPIRLPKPVILPRKNSVASMEPFQEAIDRVYQTALFVPRRRSDDAIVDDICEFFDDFGFDDAECEGGLLAVEPEGANDADDMDVDGEDETVGIDTERFTTPPGFPQHGDLSPLEKVVAKDVVQTAMAKSAPPIVAQPPGPLPPVDNEETLRARGIARLAQRAAEKGSQTSRPTPDKAHPAPSEAHSATLPLLPPPEESMLDAVLEASQSGENDWFVEGDVGGMDWDDDDDVEEADGAWWMNPAWRRNRGLAWLGGRGGLRAQR